MSEYKKAAMMGETAINSPARIKGNFLARIM
jgi:hypothetical protein